MFKKLLRTLIAWLISRLRRKAEKVIDSITVPAPYAAP